MVQGSASLAIRLGLTRLVVGLTIVAFGTSTPELVVSVQAAYARNGEISLGNIVGSNICNIALILGLSSLVRPLRVDTQLVRLQIPIMIGVSLMAWFLLKDRVLNRLEGMGLFLGIGIYTLYSLYLARKEFSGSMEENRATSKHAWKQNPWLNILFITGGLAMLVGGARVFVSGAVALAKILHISEAVIGLTIVAVGTSLPELATSLVAASRKEGDIAIGNVVGSNIFNILGILGIASLVRPIEMGGIHMVDVVVMIMTTVLALPLAYSGFMLTRWEGAILLAVYSSYVYYLFL